MNLTLPSLPMMLMQSCTLFLCYAPRLMPSTPLPLVAPVTLYQGNLRILAIIPPLVKPGTIHPLLYPVLNSLILQGKSGFLGLSQSSPGLLYANLHFQELQGFHKHSKSSSPLSQYILFFKCQSYVFIRVFFSN